MKNNPIQFGEVKLEGDVQDAQVPRAHGCAGAAEMAKYLEELGYSACAGGADE